MNRLAAFYPHDDQEGIPVAYLWANTVQCHNPACGDTIPLVQQGWLCNKSGRKIAVKIVPDSEHKECRFEIVEDAREINFDASVGTVKQGHASCPFCTTIVSGQVLRTHNLAGGMAQTLMAVVSVSQTSSGKSYRTATVNDKLVFEQAQ